MTSEVKITLCVKYWLRFLKESSIDVDPIEVCCSPGDGTWSCLIAEYRLGSITGMLQILSLYFYPDGSIEYECRGGWGSVHGFTNIDDWYLTTLKKMTRMVP